MLLMHNGDHLPERLWAYDDYTEFDEQPADSATGLTSLGFFRAALRRRKWLWRGIALAGMVIGFGFAARLPVVYQATTSLLVTPMSTGGENSGAPITNEQAIADSRTVAELALSKLGLQENVNSFLASYTVTAPTDRVLDITVSAPSSSDAVSRANALATEYLRFRAELIESEQNLMLSSLNQQISQDKQNVNSINSRISQVSAQPSSSAQQAELASLAKQKTQATTALTELEQAAVTSQASTQITTATIVQGSRQLDPATPAPRHSRLKRVIEYTALGLIGGLAVGMGIVLIGALLSDRLRRRDDVAHALGVPVKLSIGTLRGSRRIGLEAAAESADLRRVVAHLGKAVPPHRHGPSSLAVVPVGQVHVPAICLVSLAVSRAKKGLRVVVADLCEGAPAAQLLGVADPGVRTVSAEGTQLTVAVPEEDDVLPTGPLPGRPGQVRAAEPLAAACASADLLLTLAVLDPSLGGEHLAGWASGAVVVVTAGKSSAERIRAVSEMIRLSGTSLVSGVLIGADKSDESLGLTLTPDADRVAAPEQSLGSAATGFVTVDEGPGAGPSSVR
jgi:capsular polysaccharide biosynthesis protein